MFTDTKQRTFSLPFRLMIGMVLTAFISTSVIPPQSAFALGINLPIPGTMVKMTTAFMPPLVKGIKVDPSNPLLFEFLIEPGQLPLDETQKKNEYRKLVKYFLASLTTPEKDMWVNLSPYEHNRIISRNFGGTEMGRDMLAQDYILKQLTASLVYPEDDLGKKFWSKVYERVRMETGAAEVPVSTFNKVWILPASATIFEKGNVAMVTESHLKVMMEEDYLSMDKHGNALKMGLDKVADPQQKVHSTSSQTVREIVIPAIEKEINEGKNFVQLRQMYNSMVLASWFKQRLKMHLLSKVYVNKDKNKGVDLKDPKENEEIFQKYLQAYKKGVYNYIKEEEDPASGQMIPRKYFSGGTDYSKMAVPGEVLHMTSDSAMLGGASSDQLDKAMVELEPGEGINNTSLTDVESKQAIPQDQVMSRDQRRTLEWIDHFSIPAMRVGEISFAVFNRLNSATQQVDQKVFRRYLSELRELSNQQHLSTQQRAVLKDVIKLMEYQRRNATKEMHQMIEEALELLLKNDPDLVDDVQDAFGQENLRAQLISQLLLDIRRGSNLSARELERLTSLVTARISELMDLIGNLKRMFDVKPSEDVLTYRINSIAVKILVEGIHRESENGVQENYTQIREFLGKSRTYMDSTRLDAILNVVASIDAVYQADAQVKEGVAGAAEVLERALQEFKMAKEVFDQMNKPVEPVQATAVSFEIIPAQLAILPILEQSGSAALMPFALRQPSFISFLDPLFDSLIRGLLQTQGASTALVPINQPSASRSLVPSAMPLALMTSSPAVRAEAPVKMIEFDQVINPDGTVIDIASGKISRPQNPAVLAMGTSQESPAAVRALTFYQGAIVARDGVLKQILPVLPASSPIALLPVGEQKAAGWGQSVLWEQLYLQRIREEQARQQQLLREAVQQKNTAAFRTHQNLLARLGSLANAQLQLLQRAKAAQETQAKWPGLRPMPLALPYRSESLREERNVRAALVNVLSRPLTRLLAAIQQRPIQVLEAVIVDSIEGSTAVSPEALASEAAAETAQSMGELSQERSRLLGALLAPSTGLARVVQARAATEPTVPVQMVNPVTVATPVVKPVRQYTHPSPFRGKTSTGKIKREIALLEKDINSEQGAEARAEKIAHLIDVLRKVEDFAQERGMKELSAYARTIRERREAESNSGAPAEGRDQANVPDQDENNSVINGKEKAIRSAEEALEQARASLEQAEELLLTQAARYLEPLEEESQDVSRDEAENRMSDAESGLQAAKTNVVTAEIKLKVALLDLQAERAYQAYVQEPRNDRNTLQISLLDLRARVADLIHQYALRELAVQEMDRKSDEDTERWSLAYAAWSNAQEQDVKTALGIFEFAQGLVFSDEWDKQQKEQMFARSLDIISGMLEKLEGAPQDQGVDQTISEAQEQINQAKEQAVKDAEQDLKKAENKLSSAEGALEANSSRTLGSVSSFDEQPVVGYIDMWLNHYAAKQGRKIALLRLEVAKLDLEGNPQHGEKLDELKRLEANRFTYVPDLFSEEVSAQEIDRMMVDLQKALKVADEEEREGLIGELSEELETIRKYAEGKVISENSRTIRGEQDRRDRDILKKKYAFNEGLATKILEFLGREQSGKIVIISLPNLGTEAPVTRRVLRPVAGVNTDQGGQVASSRLVRSRFKSISVFLTRAAAILVALMPFSDNKQEQNVNPDKPSTEENGSALEIVPPVNLNNLIPSILDETIPSAGLVKLTPPEAINLDLRDTPPIQPLNTADLLKAAQSTALPTPIPMEDIVSPVQTRFDANLGVLLNGARKLINGEKVGEDELRMYQEELARVISSKEYQDLARAQKVNSEWSSPLIGSLFLNSPFFKRFHSNEFHPGIDIKAKLRNLFAIHGGKVVKIGEGKEKGDGQGYGLHMVMEFPQDPSKPNGDKYWVLFAHLDAVFVKEGQPLVKGQNIARTGNSGPVPYHLHLEVEKAPTGAKFEYRSPGEVRGLIDPMIFLEQYFGNSQMNIFTITDTLIKVFNASREGEFKLKLTQQEKEYSYDFFQQAIAFLNPSNAPSTQQVVSSSTPIVNQTAAVIASSEPVDTPVTVGATQAKLSLLARLPEGIKKIISRHKSGTIEEVKDRQGLLRAVIGKISTFHPDLKGKNGKREGDEHPVSTGYGPDDQKLIWPKEGDSLQLPTVASVRYPLGTILRMEQNGQWIYGIVRDTGPFEILDNGEEKMHPVRVFDWGLPTPMMTDAYCEFVRFPDRESKTSLRIQADQEGRVTSPVTGIIVDIRADDKGNGNVVIRNEHGFVSFAKMNPSSIIALAFEGLELNQSDLIDWLKERKFLNGNGLVHKRFHQLVTRKDALKEFKKEFKEEGGEQFLPLAEAIFSRMKNPPIAVDRLVTEGTILGKALEGALAFQVAYWDNDGNLINNPVGFSASAINPIVQAGLKQRLAGAQVMEAKLGEEQVRRALPPDRAMIGQQERELKEKGGIDFDSKYLELNLKGEAINLPIPEGFEWMMNTPIRGFTPQILNIRSGIGVELSFFKGLLTPDQERTAKAKAQAHMSLALANHKFAMKEWTVQA